jgi:hypothetical protein
VTHVLIDKTLIVMPERASLRDMYPLAEGASLIDETAGVFGIL